MHRIEKKLERWAVSPWEASRMEVEELVGANIFSSSEATYRHRAMTLFSRFLEAPPSIQTLHSFCQSFLQKFSLEAKIPPFFSVLEEEAASALRKKAYDHVVSFGQEKWGFLLPVLERIFHVYNDHTFCALIMTLFAYQKRDQPSLSFPSYDDIPHSPSSFTRENLKKISSLSFLSAKEREIIDTIHTLTREDPAYAALFRTKELLPRKKIFSSKTKAAIPELSLWVASEQAFLEKHHEKKMTETVRARSHDVVEIFHHIKAEYDLLKRTRQVMDFDDLITYTRNFLSHEEHMGWISLKIHGLFDHLLMDEAQDTSEAQWDIIKHMGECLLSANSHKTLFIVGDPKQSIYGFQGANLHIFHMMKNFFFQCGEIFHRPFQDIDLSTSFRSAEGIIHVVNHVFHNTILAQKPFPLHESGERLKGKKGHCAIFQEPAEKTDMEEPGTCLATTACAKAWVQTIAQWLHTPFYLEVRQRLLRAEDIMILFPYRTPLFFEILKELRRHHLPVSGHTTFHENQDRAREDLLMLGRWLLHPEDDWSLAAVLRGSLVGVSEAQLFQWAHKRKGPLLHRLQQMPLPLPFCESISYGELLGLWQSRARTISPSELFHEILYHHDAIHRMKARLGPAVQESVDIFMEKIRQVEKTHGHNLYTVLHHYGLLPCEQKKEKTHAIRVLTVHGAKGLQAPVVLLPDTTQSHKNQEPFHMVSTPQGPELFLVPHKHERTSFSDALHEAKEEEALDEYRRLLYVAITRSEERLYISGKTQEKEPKIGAMWYPILEKSIRAFFPAQENFSSHPKEDVLTTAPLREIPLWNNVTTHHTPSQVTVPPTHKNFWEKGKKVLHNKNVGSLIHQIFHESFSTDTPENMKKKCGAFLRKQGISPQDSLQWTQRLCAIMKEETLRWLWGPTSFGEVSIMDAHGKIYRIDRLIFQDNTIFIVEFKIGSSYALWDHIPSSYKQQLHTYTTVLQNLYPTHTIHQGILWVKDGVLQWAT